MNKKELADLKKEFKLNSGMLNIKEFYSVYIKKDNIGTDNLVEIHSEFDYFERLDEEKRELYLSNFKKILGGAIDTKLFELEFEKVEAATTQKLLIEAVKTKEKIDRYAQSVVEKIIENFNYENDVVVTFIKAEYWRGYKKGRKGADASLEEMLQGFEFIMGSVNKIESPKKALKFDYEGKEFKASSAFEFIINLTAPLDGFMFPVLNNGIGCTNKILYYAAKPKEVNTNFVEKILNCGIKLTAEDEKNCFTDILKSAIGDKIKPELMQEIYANIYELAQNEEEDEVPMIGMEDVRNILESCGVKDIEGLENTFSETCGVDYGFKVDNIIPDFNTKSIKITNETMNISIAPKELNTVRQIIDDKGNKCLLIEITEDTIIEGFKLETEKNEDSI